jgi:tripartite-type tricarboxylate transporter receptor subunit TctC
VLGRLEQAFHRVMNDPKIVAQIEAQGFSPLHEDSQTLAARVKRELAVVKEVFQKAGLKHAN